MVEIVESGRLGDHDLVMRTLHGYFDQYDMEHIDSVVLGCTHFVFTATTSASCCPNGLLSSTAMRVPCAIWAWCLESLGKLAPENATGGVEFANSDPSEPVAELSRKLLNVSAVLGSLSEGSQGRTRQIHSTLPISLSVQHA